MSTHKPRTLLLLSVLPLLVLLFIPTRGLLQWKRTRDLGDAVRWQGVKRAARLISQGADVNGRENGKPFVEIAAEGNRFDIVALLLESGARSTPLVEKRVRKEALSKFYWAVYNNNAAEIARFSTLGFNGNTVWNDGTNFLMVAAYHSQIATIQQLLRHGANPNARDAHHRSVLWHALSRGWQSEPFVKVLVRGGARPDVNDRLLMAIHAYDTSAARRALQAGANPNAHITDGSPLLSLSAGDVNLVRLLLQFGGDPKWKGYNDESVYLIATRGGKNSPQQSRSPDPAALALLQRAESHSKLPER